MKTGKRREAISKVHSGKIKRCNHFFTVKVLCCTSSKTLLNQTCTDFVEKYTTQHDFETTTGKPTCHQS